jgi:hypothetical protein
LASKTGIRINENYRDYSPPFDATKSIRRLLDPVPEKYLVGLGSIVLSNFSGLSRSGRTGKLVSRKRRIAKSQTLGYYQQGWKGQPAYIELYIDKIVESLKRDRIPIWIPAVRDVCFGAVFYHELGHHAHRMVKPQYREREDVADDWSVKFIAKFIRKRYWYAVPFLIMAKRLRKLIRRGSS